jgi:Transglycosylase-like domain
MKAPLIAVISVGIAAAAPAVASSAKSPNDGQAIEPAPAAAPAGFDPRQPIGTAITRTNTKTEIRHQRLVHRYLQLRNRANRLIARRDGRRAPRRVRTAGQTQWSNRGLHRAIRVLRRRIRHVRADLRDRRAGLTPGVRATLNGIAACESHGNPRAIGGGGAYRGKYQFSFGTWASVGGRGDPAAASEREQDRRAAMLLKRGGRGHWPVCG